MSIRLQRRPGDDVRAIWFLAVIVLVAAGYFVVDHFERAIAASHDRTESFYRRMVSNERIVQEAKVLSRIRDVARRDLAQVSHERSLPGTSASLILLLAKSAAYHRISVTGIEPGAATADVVSGLAAGGLTIKLRGRFSDLLQFVADLSRHECLVSVSQTEMAVSSGKAIAGAPLLDATVHATLYRLLPTRLQTKPQMETERATNR